MYLLNEISFADDPVIVSIRKGGVEREKSVKKMIADYHGYIHKLHIQTNVSQNILRDIYIDTIIVIIAKIEDGSFKGESKLSTYLYRIFYFKTIDFIRKTSVNKIDYRDDVPDSQDFSKDIAKAVEVDEDIGRMIRLLDNMCPPCRQIIMDWAYWGFSAEEIAKRIGEDDPVKFSKIKYGCIEKLKKLWNKQAENV
ncbi:RNA polymerase sigma factor [Dyadobacter diqingensis]|uniref:RNA polymerase sigma factor n=1 Tax=Dyadobacter diqingensis TaxID=2938121 RepID=UPI0020C43EDC|nr:sigma-70 family RNA polymerase sigma factor [Dyadobacter diqingensis]